MQERAEQEGTTAGRNKVHEVKYEGRSRNKKKASTRAERNKVHEGTRNRMQGEQSKK